MNRLYSAVMLTALVSILLACGVKVNTNPGKPGPFNQDGMNNNQGDPAEQAAIATINAHGGSASQDNTQPNRPVIEVVVFKKSFTDEQLKDLAALKKLRKLRLSTTSVTGSGFKHLGGLKDLTEVSLWACPVDDAGLKEIVTNAKQIKILNLGGSLSKLTDASYRQLAELPNLEELDVEGKGLSAAAVGNIVASAKSLKKLNIGNNSLSDEALVEIAKLPNLRILNLQGSSATNKVGYAVLPSIKNLEELQLSFSNVNDETAQIVSRCKNLRHLRLFRTAITDKGLLELGKLPNLQILDFMRSQGKITPAALEQFKKDHPNCKVK